MLLCCDVVLFFGDFFCSPAWGLLHVCLFVLQPQHVFMGLAPLLLFCFLSPRAFGNCSVFYFWLVGCCFTAPACSYGACSVLFLCLFSPPDRNRLMWFQCIPMGNGASTYDHFKLRPSSGTDYGCKSRDHCTS